MAISATVSVSAVMLLVTTALFGQTKAQKQAGNYDKAARATVLHDANVYVAADADAQKISLVTPGHEVVIIERNGPWVKVFANTDINDDANEDDRNKPEFSDDANVTPASGWIRDKGIVGPTTPVATRSSSARLRTLRTKQSTLTHQRCCRRSTSSV